MANPPVVDAEADPIAVELRRKRESAGIDAVLREVCGLERDSELAVLVRAGVEELRARGLVRGRAS